MNIKKMVVCLVAFFWMLVVSLPVAFAMSSYSWGSAAIDWDSLEHNAWGEGDVPYESKSWSRAYLVEGWGLPDNPSYSEDSAQGLGYGGIVDTHVGVSSSSIGVSSFIGNAHGSAYGGTWEGWEGVPATIYAGAGASADIAGDGAIRENSAEARSQRSLVFAIGAAELLSFSIDYDLYLDTFAEAGAMVFGSARAWSSLSLWDGETWNIVDFAEEWLESDGDFLEIPTGNLTLTYNAPADSWLMFETGADANAMASPVPVPPAILLLGFGIAGLIAVKRRKIG